MSEQEIQMLGTYVHGALSALHALGIIYNLKRENYWDAVFHCAWFVYDADATRRHYKKQRGHSGAGW